MTKNNKKMKESLDEENTTKEKIGLTIILGVLSLVLLIAMISAVVSTGQYIGYSSAMRLSICPPYITDVQCIGEAKAKIIADLQNDEKDTHGIQIYYNYKNEDGFKDNHIFMNKSDFDYILRGAGK